MSKNPLDDTLDIRERLLFTAIRLFARDGIRAVSMRTINTEAGSKNKSAAHYYFGNKEGLVNGILDLFEKFAAPATLSVLDLVENKAAHNKASVTDVLMAFFMPIIVTHQQPIFGRDLLKLIAKMMLEENTLNSDRPFMNEISQRVLHLLQQLMPEKNDLDLRFQMLHSFMAMTMGSATIHLLDSSPLGEHTFPDDASMYLSVLSYVSGGLCNEVPALSELNMELWQPIFADVLQ